MLVFSVFKIEAQISTLNTADSLFATGNYSKAIERYKAHNNPSVVYERIAKSYMALGNYDEALSNYSNALEAHPENVMLKFEYAKLLRSTKNHKDAAMLFDELVDSDYKNPNYQYEFGVTLEILNDSTAMNHFRKAFELDKTHQKAIYKIAKAFLIDRKHDVSLEYIEKGLESYANNVELISLKAQNYYWLQNYRESAKWFEKLIELGESSQFIHESLSYCYAKHYEYKKAVEQGLLSLQYDPNNFKNLFIQGQLYEDLDDFVNAEKYMTMALEIRDIPLDIEYMKLGYVLNRQEKYTEGIEALKTSLKINPRNETAQFYMLNAKDRLLKDNDSRLKLYEDFKDKNPKSSYNYWVIIRIKELKEGEFMMRED